MDFFRLVKARALMPLPLYLERIPCGYPSSVQDTVDQRLDLSELLLQSPETTYVIRVSGDAMKEAGIADGDLLIVDSALTADHGDTVIAAMNGEFTVKKLQLRPTVQLLDIDAEWADTAATPDKPLSIFGVVTFTIKAME